MRVAVGTARAPLVPAARPRGGGPTRAHLGWPSERGIEREQHAMRSFHPLGDDRGGERLTRRATRVPDDECLAVRQPQASPVFFGCAAQSIPMKLIGFTAPAD
jgi:hypothetical protein